VPDLLRYARFHLGLQEGPLSAESLARMREPQFPTNEPNRSVALSWYLREVEGMVLVGHEGGTNGQLTHLSLAPEAGFAIAILTNHSPAGNDVIRELSRLALRLYLGVDERDPELLDVGPEQLAEYAASYSNPFADVELRLEDGRLVEHTTYKGSFPTKDSPPLPPEPPTPIAFYDTDRVVYTEGPLQGHYGDFVRDGDGRIWFYRASGRLFAAPR
jgi:hypothetical protein